MHISDIHLSRTAGQGFGPCFLCPVVIASRAGEVRDCLFCKITAGLPSSKPSYEDAVARQFVLTAHRFTPYNASIALTTPATASTHCHCLTETPAILPDML